MGASCSAAADWWSCFHGFLAQEDSDQPQSIKSHSSKPKVRTRGKQAQRGGPAAECGSCGFRTEELARSSGGRLLCRSCVRSEDEATLQPISSEEQAGLDLVSQVLDSVSWKHWKPGKQPAQILPWLFLGDLEEATDIELLDKRGIGAVLNLIGWWELSAYLPEDVNLANLFGEHGIAYEERDSEDRLFFDILEEAWPASERFLQACHQSGRHVLVNCHAGHNRSACMVVCWLLVHEGFSLLDALGHVQRLRGTILSNHGFRLQLVRKAIQLGRLGKLPESSNSKIVRRGSGVLAGKQEVSKIINRKRLSFKYGHNSKSVSSASDGVVPSAPKLALERKTSLISEKLVEGLISQRKLSLELVACLVHWNKSYMADYDHTAEPPVVIGTGFSGDVLLCKRRNAEDLGGRPQNSLCCVKRFKHQHMSHDHLEKLQNEAVIYLLLEHPHIARLFDVYEDADEVSLVMQYCGGGTLENMMKDRGSFSEALFLQAAVQMLRVVSYIHRAGIVHRDIKPRNWVYEAERSVIKLIDFGFSAKRNILDDGNHAGGGNITGCMGTLGYLAPEVVGSAASEEAYTEKCDIWSLGVVFLEMLTGEQVFERQRGTCDGYTEEVILRDIQDVSPADISRHLLKVPEDTGNFLRKLLTKDPKSRPSAQELLEDPYLSKARAQLVSQPDALPVTEVLTRFRKYGSCSHTTRASMLAMARAPTRLPWKDFCALRATFDIFDSRKLCGTIDLEAFLAVVAPVDDFPPAHKQKEEALSIWKTVCGEEQELSYCEFLAALIPIIDDSFEDVTMSAGAGDVTPSSSFLKSATDQKWDISLPISFYLPLIGSTRNIQDMTFEEDQPVREVVEAMNTHHLRWAVVRFRSGRREFFDYLDVCHQILAFANRNGGSIGEPEQMSEHIGRMSVGVLANCSGYSMFVPTSDRTSLERIMEMIVRPNIHRVPLVDAHGELRCVFSCMDFLDLALRFDTPSAVLKSQDACIFDRRKEIVEELSVPADETVLNALRIMVSEHLTVCPAISRELSGDLGGAVSVGVVAAADLKWVLATERYEILGCSINEFLSWRSTVSSVSPERPEKTVRMQSLRKFNVVSVDRNETLHVLASRLLASKLQRIFLSSDEIARIVGIVSSREILIEVLDQLKQASTLSSRVVERVVAC